MLAKKFIVFFLFFMSTLVLFCWTKQKMNMAKKNQNQDLESVK